MEEIRTKINVKKKIYKTISGQTTELKSKECKNRLRLISNIFYVEVVKLYFMHHSINKLTKYLFAVAVNSKMSCRAYFCEIFFS